MRVFCLPAVLLMREVTMAAHVDRNTRKKRKQWKRWINQQIPSDSERGRRERMHNETCWLRTTQLATSELLWLWWPRLRRNTMYIHMARATSISTLCRRMKCPIVYATWLTIRHGHSTLMCYVHLNKRHLPVCRHLHNKGNPPCHFITMLLTTTSIPTPLSLTPTCALVITTTPLCFCSVSHIQND